MIKTKSFGLAYSLIDPNCKDPNVNPIFDVHINFWNISKKESPFIDFGIKITNYKNVHKITFSAPLSVSVEEIFDLSYVLDKEETQLIFSDLTYKFESIPKKYSLIHNDSEKIVFLPIKNDLNAKTFITEVESNNTVEQNFNMTIDLTQYNSIPNDATSVYFRFRIKNDSVAEIFLQKLQEQNYYLESAFVERQIIDIKFNDARNIDRSEVSRVEKENCAYAKFRSIHLFLMVPSSYNVTVWDNFSECRQLEDGWDKYLLKNDSNNINIKNILVYHWKKKAYRKNYFDKFTQLIKIELKDTNVKLIFYYCIIIVILGALGSGLATFIQNLLYLGRC
ncbi:MAG: hypothetical protein IJE74_09285 [Clostridia bacterium]|nr:hypothetical protein [Clostridia bacterium]